MEALRSLHERLGHREVRSYVQSGNVVFESRGSVETIGEAMAAAFRREFGFAAKALVIEAERLRAIVEHAPFQAFVAEGPTTVHIGFCDGEPSGGGLEALLEKVGETEMFGIGDRVIYLFAPDGIGRSKFVARMEKASGVAVTLRNWRTVAALVRMVNQDPV
jgi:uncharacterized protein (DUF1697 family)